MLITEQLARLLTPFDGFNVLHVGAHIGEEEEFYRRVGAAKTCWVEAQPELCDALRRSLDPTRNWVFEGVAWSESDVDMQFHQTNNVQSSSVFPLKDHLDWHPEVVEVGTRAVTTVRLDQLVPLVPYLLVNLDIQGAELQALKGMGRLLDRTQIVYSEVNRAESYEGLDEVAEMDEWLAARGFKRRVTEWVPKTGWGDAIYVRSLSRVNAMAHASRSIAACRAVGRPVRAKLTQGRNSEGGR